MSATTAAITTSTSTNAVAVAVADYEAILHRALTENNKIAKIDITTSHPMTHEIATAKMLNYCIRMLQADGWHPPTVLRAMALRESGLDRGMRGTMFQALRERRREIEMGRARKGATVGCTLGLGMKGVDRDGCGGGNGGVSGVYNTGPAMHVGGGGSGNGDARRENEAAQKKNTGMVVVDGAVVTNGSGRGNEMGGAGVEEFISLI